MRRKLRNLRPLHSRYVVVGFLLSVMTAAAVAQDELPWQRDSYDPDWAQLQPLRTIAVRYDSRKSAEANGTVLLQACGKLRAGDRLSIAPGRYVITSKLTLDLQGTAAAPIWIVAANPRQPPVITRPDARQNLINVGERAPCRYLALQHLELTGGSAIIRFYDCAQVWLDRCELHHSQHGGITVNTRNTEQMYITRNHMHDFKSGTAEAMYLGANHGKVIMRNSVIAANHVHHCAGEQGDGIELKQGSYNNWIVENHIHDTQYPCLITYGTNGKGINVVERNICYRSRDNTMQIQGEAIVRNNLIMAGASAGFASTDHQGKTRNLQVLHNTIISSGRGANLSSWNGRDNMVFANNAVYTRNGPALRFPAGSAGVTLRGNVVVGQVQGARGKFLPGRGLSDFQAVTWDAQQREAVPTAASPLQGAGDPGFALDRDLFNQVRQGPCTAGAVAFP